MHRQRLDGVRTAGRVEATGRGQTGRDPALVEPHREQRCTSSPAGRQRERPAHRRRPAASIRDSAESRSRPSSVLDAAAAGGSARTTTSAPAGTRPSRARRRWRSRRCTRCRTTAPPTARLTTKPARVSSRPDRRATCTTRVPPAIRRPRRTAVTKSSRRVSRAAAGSTGAVRSEPQADSSVRPRRRRAAMIARPARVRMRSRNPWVRARRRLFGWNVRLPLLTAVLLPVVAIPMIARRPQRGWCCGSRVIIRLFARAGRGGPASERRSHAHRWRETVPE